MKKYVTIVLLALCLGLGSAKVAVAADASFEAQLMEIEERSLLLSLVIKKLTRTYSKAKKQHDFLINSGMPAKDVERLDHAHKQKIKGMIDDAVSEINKI